MWQTENEVSTSYFHSIISNRILSIVPFHHPLIINTCIVIKVFSDNHDIQVKLNIVYSTQLQCVSCKLGIQLVLMADLFIQYSPSPQKSVWKKSTETSQPRSDEEPVRKYNCGIQQKNKNKIKHKGAKQSKTKNSSLTHQTVPNLPSIIIFKISEGKKGKKKITRKCLKNPVSYFLQM